MAVIAGRLMFGSPRLIFNSAPTKPRLAAFAAGQQDVEPARDAISTALSTLAAAALLLISPAVANASELDIISSDPPPANNWLIDDGRFLSRATGSGVSLKLRDLERDTGNKIIVVTLSKLALFPDAFAAADKFIESWYPTAELGNQKAVVVIVRGSKEGAVVAGPQLSKILGNDLIESVALDTIPILGEEEKWNAAVTQSIDRLDARIRGEKDRGAPPTTKKKRATSGKGQGKKVEVKSNLTEELGTAAAVVFPIGIVVAAAAKFGVKTLEYDSDLSDENIELTTVEEWQFRRAARGKGKKPPLPGSAGASVRAASANLKKIGTIGANSRKKVQKKAVEVKDVDSLFERLFGE